MYYGVSFGLGALSGNRYMNMFYSGFVDLVAMLSVIFVLNLWVHMFLRLDGGDAKFRGISILMMSLVRKCVKESQKIVKSF